MKWLHVFSLLSLLALPVLAAKAPLPMRLPDVATPLAYQVSLKVDPNETRHTGEVVIDLDIKRSTPSLRLNATGLLVKSALLQINGQQYQARSKVLDDELLDLNFSTPVPTGRGQLKINFSGQIQDRDVAGLFRQKEGGDWYAFTQFEATSARMAFPCFDEPGWKVPWTLALTIPEALVAVANTPVEHETPASPGWKRVQFQTTKPLPSYLVAFGIGPFDIVDGGKVGKTQLRYITPRGRAADARFAASITPTIVRKLEAYFGMPYPYEKLDSLVLPLTVGFSAMENAGLITYTTRLILAKPDEETGTFKRDYVAVAAHELSHQWFGNYVTMAWWDDLWLNESFASWMGDKITDQVMPEWHWNTSTQSSRANAMHIDRLHSTRRIHQPVLVTQDLGSAFDGITYDKGQTVLAMFETWLGPDQFQAGVHRYMTRHAWGNATGTDFINALSNGNAELAASFQRFTEQPGIPRIAVQLDCSSSPQLKLSQSRFVPQGSQANPAQHWHVPVTVRTPAGTTRLLLKDTTGELPLPDQQCPAWVEANVDGAGYYRLVYAPGELLKLMRTADLNVNEIMTHLDDAAALTESGDLPLSDALSLAEQYAKHPRREVAEVARDILLKAKPLVGSAQQASYAALWQRAFGVRARQLGFASKPEDSDEDQMLRASIVDKVADLGHDPALREEASKLTHAWLKDRTVLDPTNRRAVLRTAALNGDKALFDAMTAITLTTSNRKERDDLYIALGSFQAPTLAEAARKLMLDSRHDIREAKRLLRSQNEDEHLREGALRFVQREFKPLSKRMAKDAPGGFPRDLNGFCSPDKATELERFFGPIAQRYDGGEAALTQTLESIRLCAIYRDSNRDKLGILLAKQ
ncbi:M1 family metallopeptidase [Chitinimonas sp. BJB300]|uniref:M1 family metallopeptidase n=1 Tax=Chitinimonas sp. BJB300 TaxID=1559339 RepID=UPI000C0F7B39|nr:M1 family metallopeptidase [Chitinimonas sp. BJB300]PHV12405.1 peptidase M1 [Chitinimonas sp. BJB300]TSJ89001.1 M1 family metallopeptidase [Chitinimonas sp. BJB300]